MTQSTSASPEVVEVRIVGLPLELYRKASEHNDELMREFALISRRQPKADDVPIRLLEVIDDLRSRYAAFSSAPAEAMQAALDRGESTIDLVYTVPPQVKQACIEIDDLLDEADEYCRSGEELLTMATPPDAVAFRRWFLGEFVAQVDGAPPTPWPG